MKYINDYKNFVNERQYYGLAGAGILPVCVSTGRVLVGLRSYHVEEPHTWGTFGGKLEIDEGIDETIKVAAIRELEEETEYYGHIELVDAYIFTDGSFSYHNFFGLVDEEFEPELNWENDDAVWYTLEELNILSNKHFGLKALLHNSMDILLNIINEKLYVNKSTY
jgi:8-oxo-dGTP pyrophosphatase MutT (NUDIX family)